MVLLFGAANRKYKGCVLMMEIYDQCKSEDGFLYCQYMTQTTLKRLQQDQERQRVEAMRPQ